MGFFDSDTKKEWIHSAVNPKGSGQDGRAYLSKLLNSVGDFKAPVRPTAGMSANEQSVQSTLADIMGGKAFQDPTTSPLYSAFREQSLSDEERSVSQLRHRQSKTGMYNSGRAANEEGELRSDFGNNRNQVLGGMFENERNRDNPYTRVQAGAQFGSLPRTLEQQNLDNEYQSAIMELLFPYQTGANIAQGIVGNEMWTGPTVTQTPSGFSQISSALNSIAPMAAMAFGGGGGAPPIPTGPAGGSAGATSNLTPPSMPASGYFNTMPTF